MTETVAPPETRAEPQAQIKTPFVGLRPFTAREADFFFGRESEIRVLVANLRAARLTLLYGPSGVGKSSILGAGVAEELRARARSNLARRGKPELAVALFGSWQEDPTAGIVRAVGQEIAALGVPIEQNLSGGRLGDALAGLSDAVDVPILVVLDQFEEYFHYHG